MVSLQSDPEKKPSANPMVNPAAFYLSKSVLSTWPIDLTMPFSDTRMPSKAMTSVS